MAPKKKKVERPDNSSPPSDMKLMLQGLGVKKPQDMADALAENGIETRQDLSDLDDDLLKKLDEKLDEKGITIGDRAKLKKAKVEVNQVTVQQGNGEVTVQHLVPGQAMQTSSTLERVYLGMSWLGKGAQNVDVDASCVAFSGGKLADIIFFKKLRNDTKSMVHTGDILTGEVDPADKSKEDMERVYVWLNKLPEAVDCLVFVANVYTAGVTFSEIQTAYVRLVNADTNQELARVPLSGGGLKGNCLVFAKLYRVKNSKVTTWQVLALGMPSTVKGMTSVDEIVPMLQNTGCATPVGASADTANTDAPAKVGKASPQKPTATKPAATTKKKEQKPRSVLPCVALAVAGAAGIAAATAIFLNPNLTSDMLNSDVFESAADFSEDALQTVSEGLVGAGDLLGDGAGEVYGWAGSVVENVPGMEEIGDGLGTAAEWTGDSLEFGLNGMCEGVGDGVNAVGDFAGNVDLGGAVRDVGEFGGDVGGAMYNAGGDAVDAVGNADLGGIGGQVGEFFENAGDNIGEAFSGDCCKQIMDMFSSGGQEMQELVGSAVGVMTGDTE